MYRGMENPQEGDFLLVDKGSLGVGTMPHTQGGYPGESDN